MLLFLLSLNKRHSRYLSTIAWSTGVICVGIWAFEVQNLFPSGTLASTEKWQLRTFLSLVIIAGSLLTSLVLTFVFYKKDMDAHEAETKKNTFIDVNMDQFRNNNERLEKLESKLPPIDIKRGRFFDDE